MQNSDRPARDPGESHEVQEADRKPRHGHQTEPDEIPGKAAELEEEVRRSRERRY